MPHRLLPACLVYAPPVRSAHGAEDEACEVDARVGQAEKGGTDRRQHINSADHYAGLAEKEGKLKRS